MPLILWHLDLCELWCPQPCDFKWKGSSHVQGDRSGAIVIEVICVLITESTIIIYNNIL